MKKRVFLIGGFHKTQMLARSLIEKGYRVTAINMDRESCEELAKISKLTVFNGDGSKPFVLEDANAAHADIAIALTDRDDDNLVICELCKKRFDVKKTVAIISDPKKTEFFYDMGIDSVVCSVSIVSNIIEQQSIIDEIETFQPMADGKIRIEQVPVTRRSPIVNKMLKDIKMPKHAIVGTVLRGGQGMVPRGDTVIMEGDTLLLILSGDKAAKIIGEITGK